MADRDGDGVDAGLLAAAGAVGAAVALAVGLLTNDPALGLSMGVAVAFVAGAGLRRR